MNKHRHSKGFTIIESLVAIAILTAAIVAAMGAVQVGLSSYIFSKDQITAFYLAQEGFEELRAIRDENALNSRNWLTGFAANAGDPCSFGKACIVSPVESWTPSQCSSPGSCPILREDPTNGFYGYNPLWPTTPFRREITLSSINSDEIAVTVTVTWSKGLNTQTFKARENLLNWKQ